MAQASAEATVETASPAALTEPAAGDGEFTLEAPAKTVTVSTATSIEVPLWPQSITEYLLRRMRGAFGVKA